MLMAYFGPFCSSHHLFASQIIEIVGKSSKDFSFFCGFKMQHKDSLSNFVLG